MTGANNLYRGAEASTINTPNVSGDVSPVG